MHKDACASAIHTCTYMNTYAHAPSPAGMRGTLLIPRTLEVKEGRSFKFDSSRVYLVTSRQNYLVRLCLKTKQDRNKVNLKGGNTPSPILSLAPCTKILSVREVHPLKSAEGVAIVPAQGILIAHLPVRCCLLPSPSLGPLQPPAHGYSFLHSTSQIGPLASGRQLTSGVTLQGVLSHCDRADHRECWPSSLFHRKRSKGSRLL